MNGLLQITYMSNSVQWQTASLLIIPLCDINVDILTLAYREIDEKAWCWENCTMHLGVRLKWHTNLPRLSSLFDGVSDGRNSRDSPAGGALWRQRYHLTKPALHLRYVLVLLWTVEYFACMFKFIILSHVGLDISLCPTSRGK